MEEAADEGRDGICYRRSAHPVKQRSSYAVDLYSIRTWCSVCGAEITDGPNPDCKYCTTLAKLKEENDA